MDKNELLIILESVKSHFEFFEYLEKTTVSTEHTAAKLAEVKAMSKDINLEINILKKA